MPSRYVIKQQPQAGCLSTLEAVHELLLLLDRFGLDHYPQPEQLLGIFQRMQDFQILSATDPNLTGYRRKPYSEPSQRTPQRGFQLQGSQRLGLHLAGEEAEIVAAVVLGAVEVLVGVQDEGARVVAVARRRDADARS